MSDILILDDDTELCMMLHERVKKRGHIATVTHTLETGVRTAEANSFDVILLDVDLPDGNGLEYIQRFKNCPSAPEVIIITGQGEADGAENAIINGAWSYIIKPHVIRELDLHLTRALQYRKEKQKITPVPVSLKRNRIIGTSKGVSKCLDQVARAAASDVNVLITGPTGTGKELFAKAIHENSERNSQNFVIVDCAALPETLIESTLFGHVKGAFTGADKEQDGLVKHAHQGTLFLDEVGELPISIQKTFLRLLQEREYRPVGSPRHQFSNFRLVAATNRNLEAMVQEGTFRSDLLFRLEAFVINLPPLKERIEDVRELVTYFISQLCERYNTESKGIAPDLIETLSAYDWPGNIRELYQTIEQLFTNQSLGPTCFSFHLPEKFRILQARASVDSMQNQPELVDAKQNLPSWRSYKEKCEEEYLVKLRSESESNVTRACKLSGLSRTRLYQLIEKYELPFS
ncbi:MAG: sigma-54-dependent Fis family transcriptional regulator [Desulfobulbaceae bacterium]|nr:MAG: sigma-54-dependent Fis family transcriptional regulator [Desulfobulbaceae bacterium]